MQISYSNQIYFERKANGLALIWHKYNVVIMETGGDMKVIFW